MSPHVPLLLIIIGSSLFQTLSCHGFGFQHPGSPSSSRKNISNHILCRHNHPSASANVNVCTSAGLLAGRGGAFMNDDKHNVHYSSRSSDRNSDDEYESYDSYDDYDADVDAEVITSGGRYDKAASTAKPMSNYAMDETTLAQIGKTYFLTSLLWLSLAFDVVTNSKKRSLIFPAVTTTTTTAMTAASIGLSSGFILSSTISYLLSVEFNRGASTGQETLVRQKQRQTKEKNEEEHVFTMNERVRKKMHLYLFLFGILNLGANINPSKAPFLGMSGFIINVHNALNAFNSWKKDALVEGQTVKEEFMDICRSFYNSLFFWRECEGDNHSIRDSNGIDNENDNKKTQVGILRTTKSLQRFLSTSFSIATLIALIRGAMIIVLSLMPYYLTGSMKVAPIEKMRYVGLQWAKLARAVLCGGLCLSLRDEVQNDNYLQKWGYKNGLVAFTALLASMSLLI